VRSMSGCSSGMSRSTRRIGFRSTRPSHSARAGMPWSWYTPLDARSLMEHSPMVTSASIAVSP